MVSLSIGSIDTYLIVATPAKHSTNGASATLLRFAVQREHHFGSIAVSIASAISIAYDFQTRCERFLRRHSLSSPVAMHMSEPHIATAQCQLSTIKALQRDGTLLLVRNLRPCLYHIHRGVSLVIEFHGDWLQFIFHRDDGHAGISLIASLHIRDSEFKIDITINMLYLESRQMYHIHRTEGWHGREIKVIASVSDLPRIGNLRAIISHAQVFALIGLEQHCGVGCAHLNLSLPCEGRKGAKGEQ